MTNWNFMIIFTELLLLLDFSDTSNATQLRCTFEYFMRVSEGTAKCERCPSCPPGYGLKPSCGSTIDEKTKITCIACRKGHNFNPSNDASMCRSCGYCLDHQEIISNCSTERNTVCGNCIPGYFKDPVTYICLRCSPCCGDEQDVIVDDCKSEKGLGRNICSNYHRIDKCPRQTKEVPTTQQPVHSTKISTSSTAKTLANLVMKESTSGVSTPGGSTQSFRTGSDDTRCVESDKQQESAKNKFIKPSGSINHKRNPNVLVLNKDIFISVTATVIFVFLALLFLVASLLLRLHKKTESRFVVDVKTFLTDQKTRLTDEEVV